MSSPVRLPLLVGTLLLLAGCLTPADKTRESDRAKKLASRFRPRSLAYSPDGSILAVGLATTKDSITTGGIRFLDAATLHSQSECELDYAVTNLMFSPDGKFLFLGGQMTWWPRASLPPTTVNQVGWLDPATHTSPGKPDVDWEGVQSLWCSADRRALAWVSSEKRAVVVRPLFPGSGSPGSVPFSFKTGDKRVLALVGERGPVAVADAENRIQLIEPDGQRPPAALSGHQQPVLALLFTADGKRLISAAGEDFGKPLEIFVWDVPGRRLLLRLPGLSGPFNRFFLSEDGRHLAVGVRAVNESTDLTVWNLERGEQVYGRKYLAYGTPAAFSPDGRRLAVVDYSGEVMVLDLRDK